MMEVNLCSVWASMRDRTKSGFGLDQNLIEPTPGFVGVQHVIALSPGSRVSTYHRIESGFGLGFNM